MSHWTKFGLLVLLLLLIAAVPLAMQFDAGSIEGVITDDRGAVEGASVDVHNVIRGLAWRAESDANGHYELSDLPAGHYSLWVQADGHDSIWIPQILIEHGQSTREDFRLVRNRVEPTSSMLPRSLLPQGLK